MKSHSIRAIAVATLLLGFFIAGHARAQQQPQQRGPSTAEERARAVKVAHELEEDPLAKDAKDNRDWVYKWIVDIPDITVSVCYDYFGKLPKPPRGHSLEIVSQMAISSAAFMIEHPDKAEDVPGDPQGGARRALALRGQDRSDARSRQA